MSSCRREWRSHHAGLRAGTALRPSSQAFGCCTTAQRHNALYVCSSKSSRRVIVSSCRHEWRSHHAGFVQGRRSGPRGPAFGWHDGSTAQRSQRQHFKKQRGVVVSSCRRDWRSHLRGIVNGRRSRPTSQAFGSHDGATAQRSRRQHFKSSVESLSRPVVVRGGATMRRLGKCLPYNYQVPRVMALTPGTRLAQYEIVAPLGSRWDGRRLSGA